MGQVRYFRKGGCQNIDSIKDDRSQFLQMPWVSPFASNLFCQQCGATQWWLWPPLPGLQRLMCPVLPCSTSTLQRYFPTTLCRGTPLAVPPLCRGTILLSALYIAEVLPALHSPYFHSAKTPQPLQFLQVLCNQGLSNQVTKILLCLTSTTFRTSILYSALFYTAQIFPWSSTNCRGKAMNKVPTIAVLNWPSTQLHHRTVELCI